MISVYFESDESSIIRHAIAASVLMPRDLHALFLDLVQTRKDGISCQDWWLDKVQHALFYRGSARSECYSTVCQIGWARLRVRPLTVLVQHPYRGALGLTLQSSWGGQPTSPAYALLRTRVCCPPSAVVPVLNGFPLT